MRKAVIIGINYLGTQYQLDGCINDANNIRRMLMENLHFPSGNIILMTDETKIKPTRKNILSALNYLFETSNPGDFCLVHYSGHGGRILDRNHDENDRQDETLIPIDYDRSGCIIDDELRLILGKAGEGVKVVGFFDCCHSATSLDLKYRVHNIASSDELTIKSNNRYRHTSAEVCLLSGSRDAKYAYDINFQGKRSGALTLAILETLKKYRYNPTRKELLNEVRNFISNNRLSPQIPQMSFGNYPSLLGSTFPI